MLARFSPARIIILSFAATILVGTLLLKLPASSYGISWLDAFFEATSAVTVTGLQVVTPATDFTPFGQGVLVGLIQVGGIGIMTATTVGALLVGRRIGLRNVFIVREELQSPGSPRSVFRLVGQIALITVALELVGVIFLTIDFFRRGFDPASAVGYAIFHAVSAFCNAGFDIFERGISHYAGDLVVNLVFVALIVMGGLGFPVLVNLFYYRRSGHLTLHSKLVLVTYAILVMVGIVSVALLEWTNPRTLGGAPISIRLLESLFQGVTPRTAGFATINYSDMHDSTVLMQIVLMFIGTAPASTGGGIKVTTLAFIYLILLSQVRGETEVSVFRRRIPPTLVAKTLSVLALASVLVIAGSIALVASEGLPLQVAMFEVTSALGTVGLSLGPTPDLSPFGKLLIIFLMFVGRLGPIMLILALSERSHPKRYAYPQEEIAIG